MELAFTRITSNNEADNRDMQVFLWDCGPAKPLLPKRPKRPVGKEGEPEFDLAMIEYNVALEDYTAELKTYKARKAEYDDFQTRYGGPREIQQWSCDARDTLQYDKEAAEKVNPKNPQLRYFVSSRTRGWEKVENRGLPAGMKPGPGQRAQEERERQASADAATERRSDPVFGNQEKAA